MRNRTGSNNFLIFLVIAIIAFSAIVFLFFVEPKEDDFYHVNATITYDGLTGLDSTKNNDITIEAGDKREVYITFKVNSDSQDDSKGIFRFDLENFDSYDEYLSGYDDGTTFEVTINKVKSTSAVLVVLDGCLYLVDAHDNTLMYTLPSNTKDMTITFALTVRFADELPEDVEGQKIGIQLTGKMINSASRLNRLKTVTDFKPYFDTMTAPISYTSSITYTLSSDGSSAILTGVADDFLGGDISVPAYTNIDGSRYLVKSIADNAFSNNNTIESVWFSPDSKLQSIGNRSFYNCKKLMSITIPASVSNISDNAFEQCYHLSEVINLSDMEFSLGSNAYGKISKYAVRISDIDWSEIEKNNDYYFVVGNDNNTYMIGYVGNGYEIALPTSKSYRIKNNAFNGSAITSVSLPTNITSIDDYAFANCSNLTSINIAGGVKSIGNYAFYNCSRLSGVEFVTNSVLRSIGEYAFSYCNSLQNITLPTSVEDMDSYVFYNCNNLQSFTIVENAKLNIIEPYTFANCRKLTTLNFAVNSNLETISEYAFKDCTALENITIPKTIKTIESYTFYNCNQLKTFEVVANSALQNLSSYTFQNCTSLSTVKFGTNCAISSFDNNAFSNCTALNNFTVPSNITTIGNSAFYGCTGLENISFASNSKLKKLGSRAFYGCSSLPSITLVSSLVDIGDNAFVNCDLLTEIVIPDDSLLTSLDWIKPYTFITTINIPKNVTSLSNYAFSGFEKLTSVTIASGSALNSIGNYAFANCEKLSMVTFKGTAALKEIGDFAFSECARYLTIGLPSSLKSVGQKAFYKTLDKYYNDPITYYITIDDNMYLDSVGTYAFYHCKLSENLHFSANLKSIADYAFAYCYYGLKSVSFSANSQITSIGTCAFSNCYTLDTVSFANNSTIESIGSLAFGACSNMTSLTFGDNCTVGTIGASAFYNCNKLSNVVFGNNTSLQSIGNYAFSHCNYITEIIIPEGTTSIGDDAFYSCYRLTSITLPSTLTSLGSWALGNCYHLAEIINKSSLDITSSYVVRTANSGTSMVENVGDYKYIVGDDGKTYLCGLYDGNFLLPTNRSYYIKPYAFYDDYLTSDVTIPGNVLGIGSYAFYKCNGIKNIVISNGVKYIDSNAFYDCEYLNTIILANSVESIGRYAFSSCDRLNSIDIASTSKLSIINESAFLGCINLTSILLPSGLEEIGSSAFHNCHRLAEVINYSNLSLTMGSTENGRVVYNAVRLVTSGSSIIQKSGDYETIVGNDGKTYIVAYYGKESSVTIPSCYGICGGAFYNNDSISSVAFPSGLNSIGNYAFYSCNYITSLSIPYTTTKIGEYAFYNCSRVNSISFGSNSKLVSIGADAFKYLAYITTITIPSGVTSIGSNAFDYCYRLAEVLNLSSLTINNSYSTNGCVGYYAVKIVNKSSTTIVTDSGGFKYIVGNDNNKYLIAYTGTMASVTIPSGYYGIRYGAFYNNDTITAVTIPSSVVRIDSYAFSGCNNLKTVSFTGTPKLESIGSYAFYSCDNLEKFTMPSKVKTIGEYAFAYTKLTSVTIPSGVTTISKCAFYNSSLTKLSLGSGVKYINEGAFAYTKLTSVTIPSNVTYIYGGAFNISTLQSVTFQSENPPSVGYSSSFVYHIFPQNSTILFVYVPDKYYDNYIKSSKCELYKSYIKKTSEK